MIIRVIYLCIIIIFLVKVKVKVKVKVNVHFRGAKLISFTQFSVLSTHYLPTFDYSMSKAQNIVL